MEMYLWILVIIMAVIIIALFVKIHFLQKAAKEIDIAFTERLITDTNTLIDISSNDRYIRHLANTINKQLRILRAERHKFQQGDIELKDAITNISHDLRTPLTAICGYLDLLEKEEKSETVEQYIEIIKNRSEMMVSLTEELFRYSVILSTRNHIAREAIAINNVLEESIAAFYSGLSERNIIPNIKMPEEKIIRMLDRAALSRVFSNVMNNVVKYSDGDLDITLYKTGEIVFTNTASGLNEIQVGKLFDRFFTVEAGRKSTGLGLAIAKNLVEQMDGTIAARYDNNRLSISIVFSET